MNNKEIFYKKIINELHSSYKNNSNLLVLSFYYFSIDNFIKTKEFDFNNPVHRYFTHLIDINYELYQSKSYRSDEDLMNYNTDFDLKNKALDYFGFSINDNYDIDTDILDSFEMLNYIIQNIFVQSYLLSHNYTIKMNDNELKEVINDLFQPIYELPKNQHQEIIQFLSI